MDDKLKKGAVWHGPWGTGMIEGNFGNPESLHFSMTNGSVKHERLYSIISFFPFSSKKNNKALLILPPGSVPWGNHSKYSYLLRFRILTTVEDLQIRFKYKNTLSQELCREFSENYAKLIKNRKKRK